MTKRGYTKVVRGKRRRSRTDGPFNDESSSIGVFTSEGVKGSFSTGEGRNRGYQEQGREISPRMMGYPINTHYLQGFM